MCFGQVNKDGDMDGIVRLIDMNTMTICEG